MRTFLVGAVIAAAQASASLTATCRIEGISSAAGGNHVLFHGVSPDGRTLAVGWDRGSGKSVKRGAFLLDLWTKGRTDLPHLNNAPSFSTDGRFLVSANYAAEQSLRTEVVELDRRTGQVRIFASSQSGEWLASYSSDGGWILFNSTRTGGSDLYRVRRSDGAVERLTTDPRYEAAFLILLYLGLAAEVLVKRF